MNRLNLTLLSLLFLIITFISWPLISKPGMYQSGDSEYYLARIANFHLAIDQGQFPPRWAPNLNFGLGYPVLNTSFPLILLLTYPLHQLVVPTETILKLILITCLYLSAFSTYRLTNIYTNSLNSSLLTLAYVSNPYNLTNYFVRVNLGEIISSALLPLSLLALHWLVQHPTAKKFAITSVLLAFCLTNNVSSVFSLLVILVYTLTLKHPRPAILSIFLSLALSATYLLPSFHELRFTTAATSSINQITSDKFLTFSQLIPLSTLTGNLNPSLFHLTPHLGVLLAIIFLLRPNRLFSLKIFAFLSLLVVSFIMITHTSSPLYRLITPLHFVQFPFRWLFILNLSGILALTFLLQHQQSRSIVVLLTITSIFYIVQIKPSSQWFSKTDDFYQSYPLTSTAADEFNPLWFNKHQALALLETITSSTPFTIPSSNLKLLSQTGTNRQYLISTHQAVDVIEPTLYFPGWQTHINHQQIDLYSNRYKYAGLLNFSLEPGTYIITTYHSQQTFARQLGNFISLISLFIIVILFIPRRTWPKPLHSLFRS